MKWLSWRSSIITITCQYFLKRKFSKVRKFLSKKAALTYLGLESLVCWSYANSYTSRRKSSPRAMECFFHGLSGFRDNSRLSEKCGIPPNSAFDDIWWPQCWSDRKKWQKYFRMYSLKVTERSCGVFLSLLAFKLGVFILPPPTPTKANVAGSPARAPASTPRVAGECINVDRHRTDQRSYRPLTAAGLLQRRSIYGRWDFDFYVFEILLFLFTHPLLFNPNFLSYKFSWT